MYLLLGTNKIAGVPLSFKIRSETSDACRASAPCSSPCGALCVICVPCVPCVPCLTFDFVGNPLLRCGLCEAARVSVHCHVSKCFVTSAA